MDPIVSWTIAIGVGAIIIVFIAVMLGLILAAAKSIDGHARQIWLVGKQIAANTATIWVLESIKNHLELTQHTARKLAHTADSMGDLMRKGKR
jgi:hypothetical protein